MAGGLVRVGMKGFYRKDLSFSLCGLNCALCAMKLDGYCPGCGGGAGNQGCSIARCSLQHDIEYCFECPSYPCEKYDGITEFDSFITHRNQLIDMEKAQTIGLEQYRRELTEKSAILQYLLKNFNDGRQKSLFCISVNLMDIQDLRAIVDRIDSQIHEVMTIKEKAALAAVELQEIAKQKNLVLKLNKKPPKT